MTRRDPTLIAGAPKRRIDVVLRVMRRARAGLGLLALLTAAGAAQAHKPHEHGVVKLDVALDGGELTLVVEMPLDSLVGFERAPRTDAERQAAVAALARMRDGAALFRLDAAARCSLRSATVEAPVLEAAPGATGPAGGHADLEAVYVFACAEPSRLAALDVRLFEAFRRVDRIDVQAALPGVQRKATLRRAASVLRLAP